MPKSERIKTSYPGVFCVLGPSKKNGRRETSYYIRYRKKGKLIEEKVGQHLQDKMTPTRASIIRDEIIKGNRIPFHEMRKKKKAEQEPSLIADELHTYIDSKKLLEETWLLFLQSATESFSLYDSFLNLIEINAAGLAMIPFCDNKEEIMGKNLSELSPDSKKSGVYEKLLEVIKTGQPYSVYGLVVPPQHGYAKNLHLNIKAFKVGSGLGMIVTDITERKLYEKKLRDREEELELKNINLEEANMALKFLLKKRDIDKKELEDNVIFNIKELVEPYLEKLKSSRLNEQEKNYLHVLEANLKDIVAPFSKTLSSKKFNLTPMEIRVANLVKHGKTTQEIADIINVSCRTVCFHRTNIRDKMGIKNMNVNLRCRLLELS